jgi:hypothetical protein
MNIIKKVIKEDESKKGIQVLISVHKENDISFGIAQDSKPAIIELTYNQLCSLSKLIHQAIDDHYKNFSSTITKEKTQTIYFDDPVDW